MGAEIATPMLTHFLPLLRCLRPWLAGLGLALAGLACQAQCGLLPVSYATTAGPNGALNLNWTNTVNGVTVSGSVGNSLTLAGVRTSSVPSSYPSLVDVSGLSGTITVNNLIVLSLFTYTFTPGNWVINGALIGGLANLIVQPGARIYLKGNINIGSNVSFNSSGNLLAGQVFLYPNANLTVGSGSDFRGVIYAPGGGNNINFGLGATVDGAIIANGGVTLGGITQTLSGEDQATLATVSTCSDSTAPTIAAAGMVCGSSTQAWVTFSEPMRESVAETTSNYTLPSIGISSATLGSDLKTVTLGLSAALSTTKTLSVKNVNDLAGNAIASGSSVSLSPATLYPGLYGTYYSQNGNRDGLGTFAFSGTAANRVDSTVNFNWGTNAPGVGSTPADGFSVRWTGVIKTNAAGSYGFATGSDDGVRLYVNKALLISNFSDHMLAYDASASRPSFSAGAYVPVSMEFYENGGDAVAMLGWQEPGQTGSNYNIIPAANLYNCTASANRLSGFSLVPVSLTASTCSPQTLTLTALDSDGSSAYTGYTGTVTLNTGTGRGTWAKGSTPTPAGTLVDNGNGTATYTFVAADAGVAKFSLSHSLAQNVTASVTDGSYSASTGAIQFRDNAFVFAEDLSAKVTGSDVAVAGRPHDMTLSLLKKDPSTGSCGVATDYTGSRALKFWRSDVSGSYTAPTVVSPVLTIPASQPASSNLTLSFVNGVASFNLGSTDIGRYSLNALDDSLTYAATAISGAGNTLTVRPFVVMVLFIKYGSTANPNGAAATDTVFAPAGASFGATVAAYTWNAAMLTNGADPNNTGTPLATATETAMKAGNRAATFTSTVTLSPLAGSQTPATGVLGTLSNGSVAGSSFSNGAAAVSSLQYSEVGSFLLNTTDVVSNFLGSGLNLDAVVVNNAGSQNARIGRFVPAGFVVSNASLLHRSAAACSPASSFSYLGEAFRLGYTLTARNALGATTVNYTGSFAKLDLATAANHQLKGIAGSTVFSTSTSPARLTLGSASGAWVNGVASGVSLTATAERASTVDGPFSASFGIAPVDSDGVGMLTFDLDTSSPADGNDHSSLASVALRHGRLRLQNSIGSQQRSLAMPLLAQYWDGSGWADNSLDSCTVLPAAAVSFGNLRKSLTSSDTSVAASSTLTLSSGRGSLVLAAPGGGRSGTVDVALSLGSTATDASCLQPWTPPSGDAATAGAALPHLRGGWCGSGLDKDPSARASFGLYRGNDNLIYQREAY